MKTLIKTMKFKFSLGKFDVINKFIAYTTSNDYLTLLDYTKVDDIVEETNELKFLNFNLYKSNSALNFIKYNERNDTEYKIYAGNENGIFGYKLEQNENKDFTKLTTFYKDESILKLSGCGISFNSTNEFLAIGDLSFKLHIFDTKNYSLLRSTSFDYSIRSLTWVDYINFEDSYYYEKQKYGIIYVGLMIGGLYSYDYHENNCNLFEQFET